MTPAAPPARSPAATRDTAREAGRERAQTLERRGRRAGVDDDLSAHARPAADDQVVAAGAAEAARRDRDAASERGAEGRQLLERASCPAARRP